jgi:hypothetical protein
MRISPLVLAAAAAASLLAAAPAHAARPHPGGTYGGLTPQDWPVIMTVTANGRAITGANIGLDSTCTASDGRSDTDTYRRIEVSRSGAFSTSFGPQDDPNPDGTTEESSGFLRGHLDARRQRITGTWELKTVTKDAAGNVTDSCDSGAVQFSARN